MKKVVLLILAVFTLTVLWSQKSNRVPLIGEKAPTFKAKSTSGSINFPNDYGRNWKMLFSHPQDFTPVCSSEILELAYLQEKFNELGVKVVVISTDNLDRHHQWKKALEEISYNGKEKINIEFPIVDDANFEVSRKYGMIHSASSSTKDVRGVFIIDPNNIVQSISFYPMSVGRNIDEIIRLIEALQTTATGEYLTPANWTKGNDLLVPFLPDSEGDKSDLDKQGYYKISWFMMFKRVK